MTLRRRRQGRRDDYNLRPKDVISPLSFGRGWGEGTLSVKFKDTPGYIILAAVVVFAIAFFVVTHLLLRNNYQQILQLPPQLAEQSSAQSVDDPAYKAKLARENRELGEKLMKENELHQKEDFCAAWRPEYRIIPITSTLEADWLVKLKQSAEAGDMYSQAALGHLYLFGDRVDLGDSVGQSDIEAFKWIQKAAKQGVPAAQGWLGKMYSEGLSVKGDYKQAYFWLSLSAIQGTAWTHTMCYGAEKHLEPATVSQVNADVLKWLKDRHLLKQ
jgi:TPR repeat protein